MARTGAEERSSLEEAYRRALEEFLPRPEVTGVDIGYMYEEGHRTATLAVRVHVRSDQAVPTTQEKLDALHLGVPSEVLVRVSYPEGRRDPARPVQPGVSVGTKNGPPGTLGLFVRDANDEIGLITALHVLAGGSGKAVSQPAPEDLAGPYKIANLERSMGSPIDAAFARKDSGDTWDPLQFGNNVIVSGVRRVVQGKLVEKSSRSTEVTKGIVEGVGIYKLESGLEIEGFIIVPEVPGNPNDTEISARGDSGAVWYDATTKEGYGLHLAGEREPQPEKEHAIASHLDLVFEKLKIKEIYQP